MSNIYSSVRQCPVPNLFLLPHSRIILRELELQCGSCRLTNSERRGLMFKPMSKYLLILTALTLIGFLFLNPPNSLSQKPADLFTDDEASKLRFSDSEWEKETIQNPEEDLIARPTILFEEPHVVDTDNGPTITTTTPADILVLFEQNNSTLNLNSLDVWGEKWILKINITDRVRPHIKKNKEGAVLHMTNVHIPEGNFKLGIKIADVNGQETVRKYRLKIE
jgi:hypothetical protein